MKNQLNQELDTRKVQKLVDEGIITHQEIADAEVVFMCGCGKIQNIKNDICEDCGRDIS